MLWASQVVKNPPANAGDTRDMGSIPESGRSPGIGSGNLLQYSCLENSLDRIVWWAIVNGATKSWTRLRMNMELINYSVSFLFSRSYHIRNYLF